MTEDLSTRCVHAGELDDAHGSPHTPIYTTTTFKFASTADLLDVVDGRKPGSLLLARNIRTLPVRVRQQNATAQAVAEAMARHPQVARVYFPGLPDFPGHVLAKKQMSGFGGMLSIEVKGDGDAATRVADRLQLFALARLSIGLEDADDLIADLHQALESI